MRVLIVGGKLQGTEACYLAHEAGWHVTLVDQHENPLASRLCNVFIEGDATELDAGSLSRFDLIFPATENLATLSSLVGISQGTGIPLAFDLDAYRISSSKSMTNRFLADCGVATPPRMEDEPDWPEGYLVKPDSESGSTGVLHLDSRDEAYKVLEQHPGYLGQVFLPGPVLSIEVVCNHDIVRAFTVTEVVVGDDYDCHRIVAPAAIDAAVGTMIHDMALQIGRRLDMQGIFDIELIMYKGIPHVLEIDARFPSQTPIAIYHATGLNLFEETARVFLEQRVPGHPPARKAGCSILQHVRVNPRADGSTVEPIGECQLRYAGPFTPTLRFAGVESMLESTGEDGMRYVTLIASGTSHETVDETMRRALRALAEDEDERLAADMEPLY